MDEKSKLKEIIENSTKTTCGASFTCICCPAREYCNATDTMSLTVEFAKLKLKGM